VADGGVADGGTVETGLLRNPSLETDTNADNVPDCWRRVNTGTTTGGWSRNTDAHSGGWAQTARVASLGANSDRRLIVFQDTGACSPVVTPGRTYRVSAWYKTSGRAGFVASYRTAKGWVAWTSGPDLPSSSTYRLGEWMTPPVPEGALNISVGLALRSVTTLTMDDFRIEEVTPPATLALVAPNGGEALRAGSTHNILWNSSGPWQTVSLAYSADQGATWSTIAADVPNTGSFSWTVPDGATTHGLIRVSSTSEPLLSDVSDAPFSVTAPTVTVIPEEASWKYLASGVDPGPGWNLPAHDDAAWPEGPAELGHGEGDEATVLPTGSPSVYFRRHFSLTGPVTSATATVRHVDGVAIWVNGSLVYSVNMDHGLEHAAAASASLESTTRTVPLRADSFVAGENTIAVMVKHAEPAAPDLSFRLKLDVSQPASTP